MAADPSQMRFDYVSPRTIKHDAPQVRRDWRHDNGMDKLKGLELSIRQEGILQPLLVRPLPAGQSNGYVYELLAGHGRLVCAGRIPLELVPILVHAVDDDAKPLVQLSENMHRRHLAAVDEAVAMRDVMAARGWTQTRMADALGVSASLVSQRLGLLRQEVLRDALERDLIAAHTATLLRGLRDDEHSQGLYAQLERGERVREPDVRTVRALQDAQPSGRPTSHQLGFRAPQTEDRIQRAVGLRATGLGPHAIAQELGVSPASVYTYLQQHDAAREQDAAPHPEQLSRQELARRAHALRAAGRPLAAIGGALGVALSTVKELLSDGPPEPAMQTVAPTRYRVIDLLPEAEAAALAQAAGANLEMPAESLTPATASPPSETLVVSDDRAEPQYSRNPEHIVVEAPLPRTVLRREPTLADLLEPLRHGPCWLPLGRLLVRASTDGLSAADVLAAYRMQQ